jgi:hypothetical protein
MICPNLFDGPAIEKGVPIPPLYQACKFRRILRAMSVGDSVLIENRAQINFLNCARRIGAVVTSRKIDGGGMRIWLIKPAVPLKKGKR